MMEQEVESDAHQPNAQRADLPYLLERIKAMFFDVIIMIILMMLFTQVFDWLNYTGTNARIYALIFIFLYEPLMVMTGGTLGHRAMKMRIRRMEDEAKNISIPMAFLRIITKTLLGWISLLTVSTNPSKRAIHDLASNSIVIRMKKLPQGA